MIIYTHRIYIYTYMIIHADLKSWPTLVFDQACAQHDTAGWISWTPSHPTSSPIRTPCRWRSLDSRLVLPVWPGSIHLSYWNLLRWSKELWNGQYGKDCDTKKKWSAATEHSFTRPQLMVRLVQDPVDHLLFHSTNPSITQWINRIAQSVNQPLAD